jgi:hypothetical protein
MSPELARSLSSAFLHQALLPHLIHSNSSRVAQSRSSGPRQRRDEGTMSWRQNLYNLSCDHVALELRPIVRENMLWPVAPTFCCFCCC